jgi:signal transduction histidine kinase
MERENPFVEGFSLNVVALSFADVVVEENFVKEHIDTVKPLMRLTCIIAILYYSAFLLLDIYLQDGILYQCLFIRGCVLTTMVCAIVKSYKDDFYKYAHKLLAFSIFSAALGIIAIIAISEAPLTYLYYSGLMMVFMFAALLNLKYQHSFILSVVIIIGYNMLLFFGVKMTTLHAVASNVFLISGTLILSVSNYYQEYYLRRSYVMTRCFEKEQQAKEFAEAANRAKTEFLTIMNHEFRTPLTTIRANSEMIDLEVFGALAENQGQYKELAGHIKKSSMHLLELINQTLDIAKNNAGMLDIHEEAFDLVRMLQDCLSLMDGYEADKNIPLVFESTLEEAMFNGDEQRLKQAIVNLLSNAIKFSKTGQTVTVILERTDDGYAVMVRDEGAGIPDDDQEKIFRPFEQSRNAMTRKHDGTGLGLPFVKQITELHRGTVTLHSTLGKGTMVRVTLPVLRKVVL